MKGRILLTITFFTIMITGCVGKMPKTAEEFRQAVPGAFMMKVEKFEVDRPLSEVAKTFQKKAPQCLDVRIKTTSQTYQSYQVIVAKYNPTVIVTKDKAELHVQEKHEKGVLNVYEEHEKGHFIIVVDAIPISKKKTQIVMYRPSKAFDVMIKAIKGWATGNIKGCPDLTK